MLYNLVYITKLILSTVSYYIYEVNGTEISLLYSIEMVSIICCAMDLTMLYMFIKITLRYMNLLLKQSDSSSVKKTKNCLNAYMFFMAIFFAYSQSHKVYSHGVTLYVNLTN